MEHIKVVLQADFLVFENENDLDKMLQIAKEKGFDDYIVLDSPNQEFVEGLTSEYLFVKSNQLYQMEFTEELYKTELPFLLGHLMCEYYFDPEKQNDFNKYEHLMIRKNKNQLYWTKATNPSEACLLNFIVQ